MPRPMMPTVKSARPGRRRTSTPSTARRRPPTSSSTPSTTATPGRRRSPLAHGRDRRPARGRPRLLRARRHAARQAQDVGRSRRADSRRQRSLQLAAELHDRLQRFGVRTQPLSGAAVGVERHHGQQPLGRLLAPARADDGRRPQRPLRSRHRLVDREHRPHSRLSLRRHALRGRGGGSGRRSRSARHVRSGHRRRPGPGGGRQDPAVARQLALHDRHRNRQDDLQARAVQPLRPGLVHQPGERRQRAGGGRHQPRRLHRPHLRGNHRRLRVQGRPRAGKLRATTPR